MAPGRTRAFQAHPLMICGYTGLCGDLPSDHRSGAGAGTIAILRIGIIGGRPYSGFRLTDTHAAEKLMDLFGH
jgi:hypothetical protein